MADNDHAINWRDYITFDPSHPGEKPMLRGTGRSVDWVLRQLGDGLTIRHFLEAYPDVSPEALRAVFELAAESVHRKYPPKTPDEFFEGPEWTEIPR